MDNLTAENPAKAKEPLPEIETTFRAITPKGNLVGFADLTIGGDVTVRDVRVLSGPYGMYAGMPSVQTKDGKYADVCHPISGEMHRAINDAVSAAYSRAVQNAAGNIEQAPQIPQPPAAPPPVRKNSVNLSVTPNIMPNDSNVVGFANLDVGGHFAVKNIRLISGKNGMFPALPTVADGNGGYKPVCVVSSQMKTALHKAAREGYLQAFNGGGTRSADGKHIQVSVLDKIKAKAAEITEQKIRRTSK